MSETMRPAGVTRPTRVIVAKAGLDGHDRGAKVIARALVDAGMEVIYTGLRQTPDQIAAAVLQEDADVVGLSILSGAHLSICARVKDAMRAAGLESVPIVVGGIIPDRDLATLEAAGIARVFQPGTSMPAIVDAINHLVGPSRAAAR